MGERYRIHVRGHLDDRWTDWFGGLELHRQDDGTTVLSGPIVDQAALHGVIACIRDLGLPLLAVDRADAADGRASRDPPPDHATRNSGRSD
jgi:hypothetical protein